MHHISTLILFRSSLALASLTGSVMIQRIGSSAYFTKVRACKKESGPSINIGRHHKASQSGKREKTTKNKFIYVIAYCGDVLRRLLLLQEVHNVEVEDFQNLFWVYESVCLSRGNGFLICLLALCVLFWCGLVIVRETI